MKRFFQAIVVVVLTLVALLLVWELREALILFIFSLAIAASTRGPANFWIKRGLSHSLGIILTYALGLIALVVLLYLVSGPVLRDIQQVTDAFDQMYRQVTAQWPSGSPFQQMIAEQLPPPQDVYNALTGEQGTQLLQGFLGIASGFLTGLAKFAIVLVLSIYWSFDRQHFERLWISLLPAERRRRARGVWRELEDGVGGYIRSELLQSVIAGLLLGIGYYIMGLKFPALIALIGALLWLIPWLGAVLALVFPLLAGLSAGIALAVIAPVYTIIILAFLELVVEPRMFDRRRYSSLLVIIMVVALADAYGLVGLLVAPPLAAAIQTLFNILIQPSSSLTNQDMSFKVENLRQRVTGIKQQISTRPEKPSPEVITLMERLSAVMEQADQLLETGGKIDRS